MATDEKAAQMTVRNPQERWVKQTILTADNDWHAKGLTPGNCQQAALASLLNVPLSAVPHFAAAPPEDGVPPGWTMFRDVRLWLREHHDIDYAWADDEATYQRLREAAPEWSDPYGLALGRTERGPCLHVVVWNLATWDLAHDPHPDGTGLTEIMQVEWLCPPYDPEPNDQLRSWLSTEESAAEAVAGG